MFTRLVAFLGKPAAEAVDKNKLVPIKANNVHHKEEESIVIQGGFRIYRQTLSGFGWCFALLSGCALPVLRVRSMGYY